jgi:hypothetical protein
MANATSTVEENTIMESNQEVRDRPESAVQRYVGRVMSGLVVTFLLVASAFPKLFLPDVANEAMGQLGWPERHLALLALIEVMGAVLYAVPRTAVLGGVLLTGLLGGAIASHLRIEAPLASHTLFPLYVGALMWGGLWLRSPALRQLLPLHAGR